MRTFLVPVCAVRHGGDEDDGEQASSFSDDTALSAEDKELLEKMCADNEITHRTPANQQSKLPPEKQEFPIGIDPDGSVNRPED